VVAMASIAHQVVEVMPVHQFFHRLLGSPALAIGCR
jgi:hypothetical protein